MPATGLHLRRLIVATALCAAPLGGCASMFGGKAQPLTVTSNPAGARLWVNGADSGATPRVLVIARSRAPLVLRLQSDGAEPVTHKLQKEVSSQKLFANLLVGLTPLPGFWFGGQLGKGMVMGAVMYAIATWVDIQRGYLFVLPTDSVHVALPPRSGTRP